MATNCYWCEVGTNGKIPGGQGTLKTSLGCCKQCQVFSCGQHAVRDKYKQEYKCWDCLVVSLIGSGTDDEALTSTDKKELEKFDPELAAVKVKDISKYKGFQEFEMSTPEFSDWFPVINNIDINWEEWPQQIARILQKLPDDKLRLLITAGFIMNEMEDTNKVTENTNPFRHHLMNSVNVRATTN